MTRNMICIGCPMGCELTVEVEDGKAVSVTGNNCNVGKKYAETEVSAPVRMVTSTALSESGVPVPVKTKSSVPKDKISDVVRAIKSASVKLPVSIGDIIVQNAADTGIPVIATKSVSGRKILNRINQDRKEDNDMSGATDFTFPSSTGTNTIRARRFDPEGAPRGIVQIAHGIAEHIERYDGFMKFLADNGFIAVGNDHLGHGKSAADENELGFFADEDGWSRVVEDMDKLHDIMKEEHPDIPYIFFGHSMGSFLTRTYLIRYPDKPDLAILCGTAHQLPAVVTAGYTAAAAAVRMNGPRADGTKLSEIAFGSYNKGYENVRTDYDWISRDEKVVDDYIADPLCGFTAKVSLFRDMMGGIRFITDRSNICKMNKELPVLFIAGWKDPVGENGKGVKRAFEAFRDSGMKHVHIKLYPECRHELLNELNKDEVMKDILGWINSKLS